MSKRYYLPDEIRPYYYKQLQDKYGTCTLCKRRIKILTPSAEFLPKEKGDYALYPFCKHCADTLYRKHSKKKLQN